MGYYPGAAKSDDSLRWRSCDEREGGSRSCDMMSASCPPSVAVFFWEFCASRWDIHFFFLRGHGGGRAERPSSLNKLHQASTGYDCSNLFSVKFLCHEVAFRVYFERQPRSMPVCSDHL